MNFFPLHQGLFHHLPIATETKLYWREGPDSNNIRLIPLSLLGKVGHGEEVKYVISCKPIPSASHPVQFPDLRTLLISNVICTQKADNLYSFGNIVFRGRILIFLNEKRIDFQCCSNIILRFIGKIMISEEFAEVGEKRRYC